MQSISIDKQYKMIYLCSVNKNKQVKFTLATKVAITNVLIKNIRNK